MAAAGTALTGLGLGAVCGVEGPNEKEGFTKVWGCRKEDICLSQIGGHRVCIAPC